MRKYLFSSKAVCVLAVVGAMAALPVSAASAQTPSSSATSIYATAQGTSVLGIPVPVLGTQGVTVTLPVGGNLVPPAVSNALDFTVAGKLTVGGIQVANLYVDPRMQD